VLVSATRIQQKLEKGKKEEEKAEEMKKEEDRKKNKFNTFYVSPYLYSPGNFHSAWV
jgi:hypothetical protein